MFGIIMLRIFAGSGFLACVFLFLAMIIVIDEYRSKKITKSHYTDVMTVLEDRLAVTAIATLVVTIVLAVAEYHYKLGGI